MEKKIIEVKNLSKSYQIHHEGASYLTLRDILAQTISHPFRFFKKKAKQVAGMDKEETFWALKDVNFSVHAGETLGIIGANGSGKSTLLKILSQITPPTTGEIRVRGKMTSLLEVGTGFHPELTGRENIFLNGAIMGMSKKEIAKKFDEIVKFAGVDKFLDTQVKYYSSGMYVRLAFSVAAHMEPDILVVDEVLAVGDAEFQKKCMGKMEEVTSKDGRTILFVSHNMSAVARLCQKAILLDNGKIIKSGPTDEVIDFYLRSGKISTAKKEWVDASRRPGDDVTRLCAVRIKQDEKITDSVDIRRPIFVEMEYEVLQSDYKLIPNYHFYNEEGLCVFVVADRDNKWTQFPREKGIYVSSVEIPGNFLSEGTISVQADIKTSEPAVTHFEEKDVVAFHVIDSFDGTSARGNFMGKMPGVVRPLLKWTTKINDK